MKKLSIGYAVIKYTESGAIEEARFEPTIKIDLLHVISKELQKVECAQVDVVKKNADLILGAWWDKMNEIELSDKEMFEVDSKIVAYQTYSNGKVKKCILEYIYQERSNLSMN